MEIQRTPRELLAQRRDREAEAIANIPLEACDFEIIVNFIHFQVHKQGAKVVVSGMGKAGQVGHNIATTLCSTGTPAVFLHPSEAQHGDLGILNHNDILLLLSNSGKTREVLELLDLAKAMYPYITAFGIVGDASSPLGEKTTHNLVTGNPPEICPLGLTPTTSTTCMMVLGDLLVTYLMDKINFSKEDYARRHHSGYLGQIARSSDATPLCDDHTP
jgi:arabinose-5-phosphate isomerase